MIFFPNITNDILLTGFNEICRLYNSDKIKILQAAEKATTHDQSPFTHTPDSVDNQLLIIKSRISRTAESYGQILLIKIIEELYDDITNTGVIGVSKDSLIECAKLKLIDNSMIRYTTDKKWIWENELKVEENTGILNLCIRAKMFLNQNVVPDYILQYVQQASISYRYNRTAAALALMTIALEGTLRDALSIKGYTYTFGSPTQDVYTSSDMHIHKLSDGYKITFPNNMPKSHVDYLSTIGSPAYTKVEIKRIKRRKNTYLEIKGSDEMLDFWSSDVISQQASIQINGLGTAIDIGRNVAHIITPYDLPLDLDEVIKAIRNNLIHLSGDALQKEVAKNSSSQPVSLGDFLNNKNRVFDAICSIGDTIDIIYNKIATKTL